ncbi:hypothetical protein CDIK_3688 [Cucumispora dikerogammari]|nr:hypothetical protein CDIK_3688 [Cucumispora dikerogammari]
MEPAAPVEFRPCEVATINFKHLIKSRYLSNMNNMDGTPLINLECLPRGRYETFPFTFPKTVIKENISLNNSFILIPLFDIQDPTGRKIQRLFFEKQVYLNSIFKNDGNIEEPYVFSISSDPHFLNYVFFNNERICINEDGQMKHWFFIFNRPFYDVAMLYMAVSLGTNFINKKDALFNEIYDPYINKGEINESMMNSTFEISLI